MSWTKKFIELQRRGIPETEALKIVMNERIKLQKDKSPQSESLEKGTLRASFRNEK